MTTTVQRVEAEKRELNLLPAPAHAPERPRWWSAAGASLGVHVLLAFAVVLMPSAPSQRRSAPDFVASLRRATPLVLPPDALTQRAPAQGRVSKEVNLEGLLSRPMLQQPPGPPSTTRPAAPPQPQVVVPPAPQVEAAKPIPLPPPVAPPTSDLAQLRPHELPQPGAGALPAPPPRIESVERPKLAFETPGSQRSTPQAAPAQPRALPMPGTGVDEAARAVARGGSKGGIIVGDIGVGAGGLGDALNRPPSPGRTGSSLELMSDPMGVDFRPYLIRILSTVRRNWFAVIPESARMGRRGKVLIQFAVNRDGSVPKLVIAMPSGTDALDRAAVAGVSASNPLPPLPAEFQGEQIRLQFTFLYNIPSQ